MEPIKITGEGKRGAGQVETGEKTTKNVITK